MQKEIDELILLELGFGKGIKEKSNQRSKTNSKPTPTIKRVDQPRNQYHGKQDSTFKEPTLKQMLRTASKRPQAILKITSFGRAPSKIKAHIKYISRKGALNLEDENGNLHEGLKNQYQAIDDWSIDFGDSERSRNTLHLVLSTPPGSDRSKSRHAASNFLQAEFKEKGFEYLFVDHKNTEHPHVHALIKMQPKIGKKLDPRKGYLHHLRSEFAEHCCKKGILVEASTRCERGLYGQSEPSHIHQMKKRKNLKKRTCHNQIPDPILKKIRKRKQIIRKRYTSQANELQEKANHVSISKIKRKNLKAAELFKAHAENANYLFSEQGIDTRKDQKSFEIE